MPQLLQHHIPKHCIHIKWPHAQSETLQPASVVWKLYRLTLSRWLDNKMSHRRKCLHNSKQTCHVYLTICLTGPVDFVSSNLPMLLCDWTSLLLANCFNNTTCNHNPGSSEGHWGQDSHHNSDIKPRPAIPLIRRTVMNLELCCKTFLKLALVMFY